MKSIFVKIPLIREKQQFQACLALTQGAIKEGKLQLEKLHPNEKAIYQGYKYKRRKESYLLGRLSAKQAVLGLTGVSSYKSIWIDRGVFQFPVVKGVTGQNIQVSISHCDIIGFSIAYPEAHPMGVDIERIDSERKETVLSQLTNKEKLLLQHKAKDDIIAFTAIFSIKEALSKILRTGMMLEFKFLEVAEIKIIHQTIACTFTHFGQYKAVAYIKNDYVFSIALPKRTKVQLGKVWQMLDKIETIANK